MSPKQANTARPSPKDDVLQEIAGIERAQGHLWGAVLTVTLAMPVLLGSAVFLFRWRGASVQWPWPWPHTDLLLVGCLAALAFTFALYATVRYRRFRARRDELVKRQRQALNNFEKYYGQLIELNKVSRTLASKATPQSLFNRITQICFDTFECERVSVMTMHDGRKDLIVRSAVGHGDMDQILGSRQGVGDGVAGWVAEHRKSLLLGPQINTSKFWRFKPKNEQIYSAMVVPVLFREQLYGVLCVSSRNQATTYAQEDLRVLEVMAWNAAVSIRHVELLGMPLEKMTMDENEDKGKKTA